MGHTPCQHPRIPTVQLLTRIRTCSTGSARLQGPLVSYGLPLRTTRRYTSRSSRLILLQYGPNLKASICRRSLVHDSMHMTLSSTSAKRVRRLCLHSWPEQTKHSKTSKHCAPATSPSTNLIVNSSP